MEQPIRTNPTMHRCACRLIHEGTMTMMNPDDGTTFEMPRPLDICGAIAANPDSPLCQECIYAGHEDLPHVPYADVIRERQPGGMRHP